jgi:hypothetical protein
LNHPEFSRAKMPTLTAITGRRSSLREEDSMHKSLLKRYTTSQVSCLLLLAAVTTLAGCKACDPPPVQANLSLLSGGECPYPFATGQQSVYVDVKGTSTNNSGYQWTTTLASLPSNTYSVQVPSKGTFKITVIATETAGNKSCQSCSQLCGPNPNPVWKGDGNFTATTAAGNTHSVTVAVPSNPTKSDCGC